VVVVVPLAVRSRRPSMGGRSVYPQDDDTPAGHRYCGIVVLDKLETDRRQDRRLRWFAADTLLGVMFVWITVESLRSAAYVAEYGRVEGIEWLLAVSPALLLFVRRSVPLTAMVVATLLYILASAVLGDSNAPLAVPLFAYSVGMTRPVRVSGWLVGGAALVMSTAVFFGPGDPLALSVPVVIMLFGIGWLIAVNIRSIQGRADILADEAKVLRAESSLVAERAVADERARIARELHDAVGHAVNVIVMQAGAARLATNDDRTTDTLRNIEQVGRSALSDLDHMLGLLHNTGEQGVPLEPARKIGDIVRLVDGMRASGAEIQLSNQCDSSLDDTVANRTGAAAYRIVQEALTNAIKHAGEARIEVTLSCTDDHLKVEVIDDGLGRAARPKPGGGRGIIGMTERANVLGGQLVAEPLGDEGFRVSALIPRSLHTVHTNKNGSYRT
jgi:signal transduction histidine kinase